MSKASESADTIWPAGPDIQLPESNAPYKEAAYKSLYVKARDGTSLALDVLLPSPEGTSRGAIFYQTRYMRGIQLRWPLSKLVAGRGMDFVSVELKNCFLAAGYAVVSLDIRGTGASFGKFSLPWAEEHRQDACDILDWVCAQPWSNEQVTLAGVSYEATAALVTIAQQHRAVRGAIAMYPFWDLYTDINLPGGIHQHRFIAEWSRFCRAMDANDFRLLPWTTRIFLQIMSRGCQPVMGGADGSVDFADTQQTKEGERLLKQAVAEHSSWDAMLPSVQRIRFADDLEEGSGLTFSQGSPVAVAKDIAQARVPLLLVAGWLDSTAGPAILGFLNNRAPGTQLVIGPWAHGGFLNNDQPGPKYSKLNTHFSIRQLAVRFLQSLPDFLPGATSLDQHAAGSGKQQQPVAGTAQELHILGADASCSVSGRQAAPSSAAGQTRSASTASGTPHLLEQGRPRPGPAVKHGFDQSRDAQSEHTAAALVNNVHPHVQGGPQDGTDAEPGSLPVHYYVMGHEGHWQTCPTWPPPTAPQALQLYLSMAESSSSSTSGHGSNGQQQSSVELGEKAAQHGLLSKERQQQAGRWEHRVSAKKHLKGFSRYQAMTKLTSPIAYKGFSGSGHMIFTGSTLEAAITILGTPTLRLWVASSDDDADVFAYLLDYNPSTRQSRYVTEGMLRASHRHTLPQAPAGHPREASQLPGQPFRSFERCHAQPLGPPQPAMLQFALMPTAFCFAPGHCIRLTLSGADAKHYTMDHSTERTIWLHTGSQHMSALTFDIAC